MKVALVFILISTFSLANGIKESRLPFWREHSEKDYKLSEHEAIYKFTFEGFLDTSTKREIHFSIDGKSEIRPMTEGNYIEIFTSPGKHIFQFFYTENFFEVYTDSLLILPSYRDDYRIYLEDAIHPIEVSKPVIYFYPSEITPMDVQIDIIGKEKFIYPPFNRFSVSQILANNAVSSLSTATRSNEANNKGWFFRAHPDGSLIIKHKSYRYLFWESEQFYSIPVAKQHSGFVIKGEEAFTFLEEKLNEAGLNSKEKADFITFWGPILKSKKHLFVHFLFNEEADNFAQLNINPAPDNLYRIYMLWSEADANYACEEQQIIPAKRDGFNVLEWGGFEVDLISIINN